jgi:heptosyltransferase-2
MASVRRILVIRGGAIGDFILTLPAVGALRQRWPDAHIAILGYPRIVELAVGRVYAQEARSIESRALAAFFAPRGALDRQWSEYFASFDVVLSYLYDPDKFFEDNLRRAGVKRLVVGSAHPQQLRAAAHFAKPLESLGIYAQDLEPRVYLLNEDRAFGKQFVSGVVPPRVAVHCGSGSLKKNWPPHCFSEVCRQLRLAWQASVVCVSGEADEAPTAEFLRRLGSPDVLEARHLRLTQLAGVLSQCDVYLGNDSGISHLAAALGVPTLVLWWPLSSPLWHPTGKRVRIIPFNEASPARVVEQVAQWFKGGARTG